MFALWWALGRITESVINYHYKNYFKRETQEGTREGVDKWLKLSCVAAIWPTVPGIETTDLGDS